MSQQAILIRAMEIWTAKKKRRIDGLTPTDIPTEILNHKFGDEHDFTDGALAAAQAAADAEITGQLLHHC